MTKIMGGKYIIAFGGWTPMGEDFNLENFDRQLAR